VRRARPEAKLGDAPVGEDYPPYVVAEIGINANGTPWLLWDMCAAFGAHADACKLQLRSIEDTYTREYLESARESPWGTTQRQQKRALEFGTEALMRARQACRAVDAHFTASPWDVPSVERLMRYDPAWLKVPSPLLTDHELLRAIGDAAKPVVVSTGMSDLEEVEDAIETLVRGGCGDLVVLACTSSYPTADVDVNLRKIETLRFELDLPIGFSCHSTNPAAVHGAVALGACLVEVHVTPGRWMYGSDQAASYTLDEFAALCEQIQAVWRMRGDGDVLPCEAEAAAAAKLRRVRL